MSEERRYGINWVDLIIKVILLILFVLLICWLFPMPKLDTFYDKVFNENIQTMKTAARDYYTKNNLPQAVGETKSMSLKQLIDNKMVLEFSDKDGKACDTESSYVQVTKTLDSEYALKVQLTCGDNTDYIIDTIGCNGTCLLSDLKNEDNDKEEEKSSTTPTSTSSKNNYRGYTNSGYNGGTSTVYYPLGGNTSSNNTTTTTVVKKPTNSGSNNNNNNNSNNNNSSNKKLYYQQAKIVTSYGNWIKGNKYGDNIENKTESVKYYTYTLRSGSTSSVYRTSSYVEFNNYSGFTTRNYSYELQLTDIPSSASNVKLSTDRYFSSSDYQAYIDTRNTNLYMSGNDMLNNSSNRSARAFKQSALKSGNFSYSISNPYKSNGVWRVKVYINIKNNAGVPVYYDSALGKKIYFVPVYFKVAYGNSSKSYTDTAANAYKYSGYTRTYAYTDTVRYYRYINERVDYNNTKWTTSRNVSGYRFTGNTKYM